jgi:hypothetical protein
MHDVLDVLVDHCLYSRSLVDLLFVFCSMTATIILLTLRSLDAHCVPVSSCEHFTSRFLKRLLSLLVYL